MSSTRMILGTHHPLFFRGAWQSHGTQAEGSELPCPEQTSFALILPVCKCLYFAQTFSDTSTLSFCALFLLCSHINIINPFCIAPICWFPTTVPAWWTPPANLSNLQDCYISSKLLLYIQHSCHHSYGLFQYLHIGKAAVLPMLLLQSRGLQNVKLVWPDQVSQYRSAGQILQEWDVSHLSLRVQVSISLEDSTASNCLEYASTCGSLNPAHQVLFTISRLTTVIHVSFTISFAILQAI